MKVWIKLTKHFQGGERWRAYRRPAPGPSRFGESAPRVPRAVQAQRLFHAVRLVGGLS